MFGEASEAGGEHSKRYGGEVVEKRFLVQQMVVANRAQEILSQKRLEKGFVEGKRKRIAKSSAKIEVPRDTHLCFAVGEHQNGDVLTAGWHW